MNLLIKRYLNRAPDFKKVFVRGEVSDAYVSRMGHLYFDLKDESSKIRCAVFHRVRVRLPFKVKDGMELLVIGKIDVYKEKGEYQIVVDKLNEDGLGQLYVKLQQLKEDLAKEGLFDSRYKKKMPIFPNRIGVVTADGGAAIKDITKTIKQKHCNCEIFLFPSLVQGKGSVPQLVRQITKADNYGLDLIIVGRGGGSGVDLWSFNDEEIARTIFKCKTPIISAVGHQKDETLIDYVADIRASTPTDAANKIVNQRQILENKINDYESSLKNILNSKIMENKSDLEIILAKAIFTQEDYVYHSQKLDFNELFMRFDRLSNDLVSSKEHCLNKIRQEYVIRHPCKMQLDNKKSKLNELETRLTDSMDSIINSHKVNLDKAANNFKFQSEKLLATKGHALEMSKSYLKTNPCRNQIEVMKNDLDLKKTKLNREVNLKIENNKRDYGHILQKPIFKNPDFLYSDKSRDFNTLKDRFMHKSNEIIMLKSHEFESIKNAPALKNRLEDYLDYGQINNLELRLEKSFGSKIDENKKDLNAVISKKIFVKPEVIYEPKIDELDKIKTSKIIRNPHVLLEDYRIELKIYEEKLDKVNQVIMLKKEQQKQKRIYLGVIVAIVIAVILIIMFGGIL